ncbi:type II toxin-antitoxin system VapC family toxin [candidate division KSB1 bacterium]|nr:type II toxin-antitoxin system VapC family toxin [candidate division KSB1 bacterium]
MISVDTNVIVRLLPGDDLVQFQKAKALFMEQDIVITTTVILECEWVLRYSYHFKSPEIIEAFKNLCGLPNVTLQEETVIADAILWHKQGLDFADAIHLAKSQNFEEFVTFDKKFIKMASKMTTFPVRYPS